MVGYWDKHQRNRFANRHYLAWFGRSHERMQGATLAELMGPELYKLNQPYIERALAGEPQRFERRLVRPDGAVGYVLAEYAPHVVDGQVEGFLATVTDITRIQEQRLLIEEVFRASPLAKLVVGPDGQAARLERHFGRDQTIYDWQHYIALVERKPGALRNGAPFRDMPEPLVELQRQLLKHPGGDRVMSQVLSAVNLHGLEAVLVATELALQTGRVSAEHVLNVIARLKEPMPARVEISTPLQLSTPALANLERYDALRDEQEARHE
jgi:PAS domain S-box-containing protein